MSGILYVSHAPTCSGGFVEPGAGKDAPDDIMTTGTTISQWVAGPNQQVRGPQGLPLFKPPYNRVSAYDMNTGERLWWKAVGDSAIKDHPSLKGIDVGDTGGGPRAILMTTGSLLLTSEILDDTPMLVARDKRTGERIGRIELPVPAQYGMMTYKHLGKQYIVVQIGGTRYPNSLMAFALPAGSATER